MTAPAFDLEALDTALSFASTLIPDGPPPPVQPPADLWPVNEKLIADHQDSIDRYRQAIEEHEETIARLGGEASPLADGIAVDDVAEPILSPVEILRREVYTGSRFPTHIVPLDEILGGGLAPGFTVAVSGAPFEGKTLLFVQLCAELLKQDAAVVILAGDEDRVGLAQRLGQNFGYEKDDLSPRSPETLDLLAEDLASKKILIFPDPDQPVTVEDVEARLVEMAPVGALRVLLADSLQTVKCRASDPDDAEPQAVTKNVEALRNLKKRTGALVLATSEANRSSYASPDKSARTRPIASFAGSRTPEFRLDVLMHITGEAEDVIRLEVVKNRLGHRKGVVVLKLDRARARWLPLDLAEVEEAKTRAAERTRNERANERRGEKRQMIMQAVLSAPNQDAGVSLARLKDAWRGKTSEVKPTADLMVEEGLLETVVGLTPKTGGHAPTCYRLRKGTE